MEVVGSTRKRQPSQGFAAMRALSDAVWRSGSPAPSLRCPLRTSTTGRRRPVSKPKRLSETS